ncbi:MAG: class I SAM-dependent methyltransferase [Flavobacteriales bacterium]
MKKLSNCPLCSGSDLEHYLKCIDYTKSRKAFSLTLCNTCEFVFTNPRPSSKEQFKYYEVKDYISHSDTKEGLINWFYHKIRKVNTRLKFNVLGNTKGTVLEIGSGTGDMLSMCKSRGWKTIGIEPCQKAREIAKKKHNIDLLENLNSEIGKVDRVMLWHVLEHIDELKTLLEHIFQILKKDGELIVAVPNLKSYDAKVYKEYWAAYDVPRHLSHFQKNSLQKLAENYNYRIRTIKPLWFDSCYISMLSEKNKNGKCNFWKAARIGLWSNLKAWLFNKEYSSIIAVMTKKHD